MASHGLAGALQDRWRCWGGRLAARTPTRIGSPSTAGPPSTPPSWPPPRAAAAAGTRSAGGSVSAPVLPNARSERDVRRAAAVDVSLSPCRQAGLTPPPPQHLQRTLQLHPAAGPAALLPLALRCPRRLLRAGPRRILQQLHGDWDPHAERGAPQDGRGCGCGAQLPRAPCSRPHTQQSPERGSKHSRQLPGPCLPPCLRGASNSPPASQPWELTAGQGGRG